MYQGGSYDFLGPTDDVVCASESFGIDFEAEVTVITGDVPMGADADAALDFYVPPLGWPIVVRTAVEALAAVLGGTQSLHTNSMDEALALPTEKAARIALRTQQVIAHETNVAHVADPFGGSWFMEELTDEMERRAEEIFEAIDAMGGGSMLEGCINGIEENWFQGRIADSAYELERAFNAGERVVVGANRFLEGNEEGFGDILRITQEQEERQRTRRLPHAGVAHDEDLARVDGHRLRREGEDVHRVADLLAADERRNQVQLLRRTTDLRADRQRFLVTDLAGGCGLRHQRLPFLSAAWPGK